MSDADIEGAVFFEPDRRHKSANGWYDAKVTHGVEEFWMDRSCVKGLIRFLDRYPVLAPSTVTKAVRQFGNLGSLRRRGRGDS